MITQDEAVAQVLASRTVSVEVAAAALTLGRNKAYRLARQRGELVPGVEVIPLGDHGYVVPTPALRRKLQLEGPPWAPASPRVETATDGPPPRPSSPYPRTPSRRRRDSQLPTLPGGTNERASPGHHDRPLAPGALFTREEWARRLGLRPSRRHGCLRHLLGGRCNEGHLQDGWLDHAELFTYEGRPAVLVSQPYGLTDRGVRKLAELAERHGLEVGVGICGHGWYGHGTLLVEVWRGKELRDEVHRRAWCRDHGGCEGVAA
jgi:hypothetical protein